MTGLTMTDCSVADNVTQAKWEFDRVSLVHIKDSGLHTVALAEWAEKWGAALLEVAAEHAGEDMENDNFVVVRRSELDEAVEESNEIRAKVREAIRELESCL